MNSLATDLQGVIAYDDLQVEVKEARFAREVFKAVIERAIDDLKEEIRLGIDIYSDDRSYVRNESELPRPLPPKRADFKGGRKRRPMQAPYAFIFGNEGEFSFYCQYLGLDAENLRDGIAMKVLGRKV